MSAGWVAGSVRATALARRRLGSEGTRRIARMNSLGDALEELADTPYGRDIRPGHSLAEAQHMAARTLLWHMRVLAGWLPRGGVAMLRALAGWFEIANTDQLLADLSGGSAAPTFELGALATAWPRLRAARSTAQLRQALAASVWGDPGGQDPRTLRLGMRVSFAGRVAALPQPAADWAVAAAMLLLAGERFVAQGELAGSVRPQLRGILGAAALRAATLEDLARAVPGRVRWILPRDATPGEVWFGEARWWARVERDGFTLLGSSGFGPGPVLGAVAVLAADTWRLRAALEMADRGGHPAEAYDAVSYDLLAYDSVASDAPG